jgi:hypothetical protein
VTANVLQYNAKENSNFRALPQESGKKIFSLNPKLFLHIAHVHAVAIFYNSLLFSEHGAVYEIMWKNTVRPDGPEMTT